MNTLLLSTTSEKITSIWKLLPNSHNVLTVLISVANYKGNLTIEHNTQILARGIQSILDKYNTTEGCIPCKGDPKRKL